MHIVGVGDDGLQSLTLAARTHVAQADVILASDRNLSMVSGESAQKLRIGADLGELVRLIAENRDSKRIVVLASGDPLFYGTARFLCDRLGKDAFEVVPHVSSMQLAFARVMESWDEAYLSDVSLHPLHEVIDRVRVADKAGLFTSDRVSPSVIAQALAEEGIDYFRVYVCENLGSRNEVVTQGSVEEIARMEFGPMNVMILVRRPDAPDRQRRGGSRMLFGNSDDRFLQSRPKQGLITPAEVRTLAIARLNVQPASIVWDIGAGSGAVSIEAAQLARSGKVYAIEPDPEDCLLVRENATSFGVSNVEVVSGRAPEAFANLPDPDCVFIGGTGRETVGIVTHAYGRLKREGNLVVNVASLENVHDATSTLKAAVGHVGLLMVNVARGNFQLGKIRFEALNPSFLVSVIKPNG